MYKDNLSPEGEQELIDLIIEELETGYDDYVCDLHNRVFNEDYFIIGTYDAKKWLEANYGVFEGIETIREYEQDNFGEVNTDFSDPEKVVNILVYILGEELIYEIEALNDHYDEKMSDEVREAALAELKPQGSEETVVKMLKDQLENDEED